jgi:hypothetical protein
LVHLPVYPRLERTHLPDGSTPQCGYAARVPTISTLGPMLVRWPIVACPDTGASVPTMAADHHRAWTAQIAKNSNAREHISASAQATTGWSSTLPTRIGIAHFQPRREHQNQGLLAQRPYGCPSRGRRHRLHDVGRQPANPRARHPPSRPQHQLCPLSRASPHIRLLPRCAILGGGPVTNCHDRADLPFHLRPLAHRTRPTSLASAECSLAPPYNPPRPEAHFPYVDSRQQEGIPRSESLPLQPGTRGYRLRDLAAGPQTSDSTALHTLLGPESTSAAGIRTGPEHAGLTELTLERSTMAASRPDRGPPSVQLDDSTSSSACESRHGKVPDLH